MIDIIPVLDIRGGLAVSGKSGEREYYRPLQSVFCAEPDPIKIANALPFERLYVADLEGIVDRVPDLETLSTLSGLKKTMIDMGVRDYGDLNLYDGLSCGVVLGTETVVDMGVFIEGLMIFGDRLIVSIDMKDSTVISGFLPPNPIETYDKLKSVGITRFIFLDISSVGTLESDTSFIKDLNNASEILVGGGITEKNLKELEMIKVDGALVGTALHNGLLDVNLWK